MQGKARKLKIYSPREYFRPLGRIKRFKWIFRKVLVFHCFMCHIAKKLLCCQKLLVLRKSTLPGTSRKDVLLPPLSALCSQEMLSFSYFEFPPFKCLSINSFQHPPRLSQFSHLKTLQRKASIENHRNRQYDYDHHDHHDHHWKVFAQAGAAHLSLPPISSINQVLFNQGASTKSFLK